MNPPLMEMNVFWAAVLMLRAHGQVVGEITMMWIRLKQAGVMHSDNH
jgi:hypothetical protein